MLGRTLIAVAVAVLLGGCLPESVNPLTPPDQGVDAPEILGLWQARVEGALIYVHVLKGDESPLEIVVVDHEPSGRGSTDFYVGHVSEIDGQRYVNLQTIEAAADAKVPYWLFRYDRNADGTLTVRFLAAAALAQAIEAGKLTGTVQTDSLGQSVRLTGEALEIAAFLAAADPATLYGRELVLSRVE